MPQGASNLPAPSQGQQQQAQAAKDVEIDPIARVKQSLLPRLKESLVVTVIL